MRSAPLRRTAARNRPALAKGRRSRIISKPSRTISLACSRRQLPRQVPPLAACRGDDKVATGSRSAPRDAPACGHVRRADRLGRARARAPGRDGRRQGRARSTGGTLTGTGVAPGHVRRHRPTRANKQAERGNSSSPGLMLSCRSSPWTGQTIAASGGTMSRQAEEDESLLYDDDVVQLQLVGLRQDGCSCAGGEGRELRAAGESATHALWSLTSIRSMTVPGTTAASAESGYRTPQIIDGLRRGRRRRQRCVGTSYTSAPSPASLIERRHCAGRLWASISTTRPRWDRPFHDRDGDGCADRGRAMPSLASAPTASCLPHSFTPPLPLLLRPIGARFHRQGPIPRREAGADADASARARELFVVGSCCFAKRTQKQTPTQQNTLTHNKEKQSIQPAA